MRKNWDRIASQIKGWLFSYFQIYNAITGAFGSGPAEVLVAAASAQVDDEEVGLARRPPVALIRRRASPASHRQSTLSSTVEVVV